MTDFTPHSTWRSLLPILEDRPLALCDSHSVDPSDLVASDRIIPDRVGEVYYLKYNPKHQWLGSLQTSLLARLSPLTFGGNRYWLSGQTNAEPYAFVMYDTKDGDHARCRSENFLPV